jgi:hypothetical protein
VVAVAHTIFAIEPQRDALDMFLDVALYPAFVLRVDAVES